MKIVSIAFVVLIAVLFFLSQKPQQNPQAKHMAFVPTSSGEESTTNVTVSCPTGTTVSGTPSCGSNSCTITCSSGSGGGGSGATVCGLPIGEDINTGCVCGPIGSPYCKFTDCKDGTGVVSTNYPGRDPTEIRGNLIDTGYRCLCLSLNTRISTPSGDVKVQDVKVGTLVYSQDIHGNTVIVPVKRVSKVNVENHHVVHLVLKDGRESWVSASHPLTSTLFMGDLKTGDVYDNSTVVSVDLIPYQYSHTYDLLPDSDTGYYFANGILMGSTLK